MTQTYKYLHFVNHKTFLLWDIKRYFMTQIASSHTIVRLGDFIKEEGVKYNISDKTKTYGILGVNNQSGIFDAYEELGAKIKQKYKKMQVGWIAYNPYRINVGSIGMRKEEHHYEYISPAYVVFSCKEGLNPEYLFLLMKTELFNKIIRENTTGSVRQNLNYFILSNLQIPLPSLEEQNKIVAAYNTAIDQVDILSAQAQNIDEQIQNYIQKELGIVSKQEKKNNQLKGFLHIFNFHQLWNRWDMLNNSSAVFDMLSNSKYQIATIGSAFKCVMRSWKKEGTTFNYIEMGCVNPAYGIIESQTIETKKAPSRATQIVHAGDLIIGTTRPYLKRFAMVTEQYHNNVCSSAFQVIAPDKTYNLNFLHEFLLTSFAVEQFEHYMTGALYPAITSKDLRKIQIPLPPLSVQNEIVEHISALRAKQKHLQQQASDLRTQAQQQFEQTIFD